MARADLILNLIKAGTQGDRAQFKKTVESMAADARAKKHSLLADRLIAQLQNQTQNQEQTSNGFSTQARTTNAELLITEIVPSQNLEDLILPSSVKQSICDLIEEQQRADLLRSHNLEPRHRVLLTGPPGNGKTSLAEALANALNVPFLVVRYESIVGSYLGETAQRISRVFEFARTRQCVLFFDEFDAISKERGDHHETGEIKRVVSSLLLQIDALPSHVVVVTASNHPELLDRAVWRRFQLRLDLPMPRQGQIETWFSRFETRTGQTLGKTPRSLAIALKGKCFAEVEEFGLDVLRRIALAEPGAKPSKIVDSCLKSWKHRFTLTRENANK